MSFITTLQFDDGFENIKNNFVSTSPDIMPLRVLHCDWRFTQMTDAIGKPTSIPKGGIINVTVETDGGNELYNWMITPTMQKSGIIIFNKTDLVSRLKTVEFKDAFCIGYHETFDLFGSNPRQVHLTISPREFWMGELPFTNNWPQFETGDNEQNVSR